MQATVIELVLFKTRPGVGEAELRAAAARATTALQRLDGFVRRELALAPDTGQWADIVHWTDLAAAEQAMAPFMAAPEAQDFITLLDEQQMTLQHLRSVLVQGQA